MKSLAIEFNRLAGTEGLSTRAAVNAWIERSDRPYYSVRRALNVKNESTDRPYLSVRKVLNELAGTEGLSPIRAAEAITE